MKKVHTEIYYGKTIDVFQHWNEEYFRYYYTAEVDGIPFMAKTDRYIATYRTAKMAAGSAKHSITLNASKADEIKKIEEQIAELQAKLEKLRG
jgi:hypothetical protein